MKRRQVRSAVKRDYIWLTAPLFLTEAPNTQDENTMVTASDWRAADGFERATILRIIITGCVTTEPGQNSIMEAACRLAVAIGNGSVTIPDLELLTTYNDFDLVAPWSTTVARDYFTASGSSDVPRGDRVNVDITCRRRISVEDNVTLVTRNSAVLGFTSADVQWNLTTKVLLQRE